jgi:hypothetical protein
MALAVPSPPYVPYVNAPASMCVMHYSPHKGASVNKHVDLMSIERFIYRTLNEHPEANYHPQNRFSRKFEKPLTVDCQS